MTPKEKAIALVEKYFLLINQPSEVAPLEKENISLVDESDSKRWTVAQMCAIISVNREAEIIKKICGQNTSYYTRRELDIYNNIVELKEEIEKL